MESRNPNRHSNVIKPRVAPVENAEYNYVRKSIRSMIDARIVYDGAVTGEHYEWSRAGAVVSVDARDVPELLAKRLGSRSCCGTSDGNQIFELI